MMNNEKALVIAAGAFGALLFSATDNRVDAKDEMARTPALAGLVASASKPGVSPVTKMSIHNYAEALASAAKPNYPSLQSKRPNAHVVVNLTLPTLGLGSK